MCSSNFNLTARKHAYRSNNIIICPILDILNINNIVPLILQRRPFQAQAIATSLLFRLDFCNNRVDATGKNLCLQL